MPVMTVSAMTATRGRLVGLGLVGLALALWSSYGPFLWPTCCHPSVTPENQVWPLASQLCWVGLLLVLYARDPAGNMWRLVLAYLAATGAWVIGYISTSAALWDVAWTLESQVFRFLYAAVLVHIALAFPSGRLTTRFDRSFVPFVYAFVLGASAIHTLFYDAWTAGFDPPIRNLFVVWPNNDLARIIERAAFVGVPILATITLWRLWRRWQAATGAGRRTLAPVMVALPVSLSILTLDRVANATDQFWIVDAMTNLAILRLSPLILPAGFLLGILRTRLARGSIADLALALRAGIPLGGLQPVLRRVLRDPTLELVFPAAEGDGFVRADGRPYDVPEHSDRVVTTTLTQGNQVLALLVHDADLEAEDPELLRAVGSMAELALANERLSAQVRAQLVEVRESRARIVEATDAERRRIERDLHDGAQQRLLALAMRLQTAKTSVDGAGELVDEATAELQAAVGEVRELARGLHPPILTDLGLGPALDALAERAAVPVDVTAPDRRYPAAVELAVYLLVSEALTNVTRYSRASVATVTVRHEAAQLVVEVADDGQGGADVTRGTGLRGLVDRVAALGGRLTIDSPRGGGTWIRAAIPI